MITNRLAYTHDSVADASYIYFGDPACSSEARGAFLGVRLDMAAIVVSFGDEGRLMGIEVLGASKVLPQEILNDTSEQESPRQAVPRFLDCAYDDVSDVARVLTCSSPCAVIRRVAAEIAPEQFSATVDFSDGSNIIGIEIRNASHVLPSALLGPGD